MRTVSVMKGLSIYLVIVNNSAENSQLNFFYAVQLIRAVAKVKLAQSSRPLGIETPKHHRKFLTHLSPNVTLLYLLKT